jgi:hypothetical protein
MSYQRFKIHQFGVTTDALSGRRHSTMVGLDADADAALEPILEPFDISPNMWIDKIVPSGRDTPWAVVCFDKQYAIADHIVSARPTTGQTILYTCYEPMPTPIPAGFRPTNVGVLVIPNKSTLDDCRSNSPLFQHIWNTLEDASPRGCWLVVLAPLTDTLEAACH